MASMATIISFVVNISAIQTSLYEAFGEYLASFVFGIIMILVPIVMLVSFVFFSKSLDYPSHKSSNRNLTFTITKESQKKMGGYLIFDVKFTSWLFNGYFVIHLQSTYLEEKQILLRCNDTKKLGYLKGKHTDK